MREFATPGYKGRPIGKTRAACYVQGEMRGTVLGAATFAGVIAVACGGSDNAGFGGGAGSGGASAAGGSAGSAGSGAEAGSAGSSAGSSSGGSAGSASGGTGATSGSGGGGGSAPTCMNDGDCSEFGLVCDEANQVCVECVRRGDCKPGFTCAANACVPPTKCDNSLDCANEPGNKTICDPTLELCVECSTEADCPADNDCSSNACVPYTACTNSLDCSGGQVCDTAAGRCVDCLTKADCMDDETCSATNVCQKECDSDNDCTPLGRLCDIPAGHCVECLRDSDCADTQHCAADICRPDVCAEGTSRCQSTGVAACSANGDRWLAPVACDPKTTCVEAGDMTTCEPWVCEAGETECDSLGEKIVECSADGLTVLNTTDCTTTDQVCDDAQCKSLVCAPNKLFCDGNSVSICSGDGLTSTVQEACGASQYCDSQDPSCKSQICEPNQPTCNGDVATTCNADGSGVVAGGTDCTATSQVCFNGSCQACAPISEAAVPLPLDAYMLFDGTGSMATGASCLIGGTGTSLWCNQNNGGYDFLSSSEATDMRVATAVWRDISSCTLMPGPDTQLQTATAALPGIKTLLDGSTPTGNSNIAVLMDTLVGYTSAQQTAGRTMVGIVMADGAFEGCAKTFTEMATQISDHRVATGIETYFMTMSGSFDDADLETLAVAGGAEPHGSHCGTLTPPCSQYNATDTPTAADVENRLVDIKRAAEKCHYEFPSGASAAKLEVTYSTGGSPQTLAKVANASACAAAPAYYYDNNGSPSEIHLCPSACSLARAEPAATIETVQQCQ